MQHVSRERIPLCRSWRCVTCHLDGCLKGAGNEETAEAGHIGEQLLVRCGFILMFKGNALLDLLEFGADPGVILIAVAVQASKGLEALFGLVVVDEPARRLGEEEDESGEDEGRDDLDAQGDAPLSSVGVDVVGAPAGP